MIGVWLASGQGTPPRDPGVPAPPADEWPDTGVNLVLPVLGGTAALVLDLLALRFGRADRGPSRLGPEGRGAPPLAPATLRGSAG
ncbi:hypothetical protein LZG04_28690 [Saccharothrix sp. S26]|uniref:hypothetical protein n=1 Tax=Saccharothrix sp. S26 TaxID=2907215 RepID=UPI001F275716|nr:hypothetical protein [Saccharothrix sp. S26]MCE6998744.1 hypothetical protein [Saccharothrix sp. S26]